MSLSNANVGEPSRVDDRAAPRTSSAESANLDLLRSAAVSFVVLFHLVLFFGARRPWLYAEGGFVSSLGHWGVLMFFVHTCLVLMRSLERMDRHGARAGLFLEFMVRRCFRLLPLSVLTVLVVVAFRLPVGHLVDGQFLAVRTRAVDVIANLLLVQNLTGSDSLEAPLWSLPFEMQMYLVLPAIFLFVRRRRAAAALGLWAAAFAFGLVWERHQVLQMPAYVPCFLSGVVAFKLAPSSKQWPSWLWPVVLAAVSCAYLQNPSFSRGWLCCLALGMGVSQFADIPRGALQRVCQYIARYSYGVYLWHFISIWFAFVVVGGTSIVLSIALFAVLLFAIPVALYHFVEAPMIRVGARVAERWKLAARPVRLPSLSLAGAAGMAVVAFLRVATGKPPSPSLGATIRGPVTVRLIGRFDARDPAGPRLAWPGSAIAARFTGTGIDVKLRDDGTSFFTVVVDRGGPTKLATIRGAHDYTIASNLPPGAHDVVVTKRTESFVGTVQYLGLKPHDGSLLEPGAPPGRRIEFVGDSITCGYGNLGASTQCSFTADTEDATSGYAALAAGDLDADATLVAYSGKGMYRDFRGSTKEQMPVLYRRSLPDAPSSEWSFDSAAPDVVVVHLGTNDFYTGDPGPAFTDAYVGFLGDLRQRYPAALFVCAVSPMLSDSHPPRVRRRTAAATAIRTAVERRSGAGDARVKFLEFDEQDPKDGYGCEDHPSLRTHRNMANKLVASLREWMRW